MKTTLAELTEKIHEATGRTGKELTEATLVAAAIIADLHGRKDIGDYFSLRAHKIASSN